MIVAFTRAYTDQKKIIDFLDFLLSDENNVSPITNQFDLFKLWNDTLYIKNNTPFLRIYKILE